MASRPAHPQMQRRLEVGTTGGDVLAVQRAVRKALRGRDVKPTCRTSGNYGHRTRDDIRAYQRLVGLNASGKVGLMTLQRLWRRERQFPAGAFDGYGVANLFRVKLGHPTKLSRRQLAHGKKGPGIEAMQRMLWRALGADSVNKRNGTWGAGTSRDLALFLKRADWTDRPKDRMTQDTWEALWPFGDDRAKRLARKAETSPDDAIRQKIRSWGEWFVQNRGRISYVQVRPYPRTPSLPIRTDCSGSSTAILKWAGAPNDPHGRGWDGQGFTGTMQGRGQRVPVGDGSQLKPGDCVFYGNQGGGVSSHVVLVIGPGDRALNFGSWPPEFVHIGTYWRTNLRTDIGARRYF